MKLGQLEKYIYFGLLFPTEVFFIFFFKFLNIVCPNWIQKLHSFYKEKLQSLN